MSTTSPFPAFVVVLALTAVSVAGYALLEGAPPARSAASPSQPPVLAPTAAEPGTGLAGDAAASAGSEEQARREEMQQAQGGARWNGWDEKGAEAEEGRLASSVGMAGGAGPRTDADPAVPAKIQPASGGADSGAGAASGLIPLAFRPLPPGVADANPQAADAAQALQQKFINAVGGPNQDPDDPAYYRRWLTAQELSDQQYRVVYGSQAFLIEQMQINSNSR